MAGKANPTGWIRVPNGGTPELPSVYTAIREALQESADSIRTLQSQVDSIKPSAPAASGGLVGGAIGSISGGGGGSGGGSVTSVGLDLSTEAAAVFGVTGSPVLTAGTITLGLDTQAANKVFAGPTTGPADEPTFRSLVAGDIPDISATYLTVATAASTYLPLAGGTLTGRLNLPASTATPNGANLNLGSGATPSSLSDGDVWVTAIGINARVAGSSLTLFPYEGGQFTGTVTTAAGTTSAAGFILASGTNLTTPAAGAVEFDGTNLYFTPSTIRRTVAFTYNTVSSVTGTSPVASSGGTTPDISLSAAYGDSLNPYGVKTANYVLAGPTTGAAAAPTFRALVAADIPSLSSIYLPLAGGTMSGAINMGTYDINNVGKVGIGTATPATILDILQTVAGNAAVNMSNSSADPAANARYILNNSATSGGLQLRSANHATEPSDLVLYSSSDDIRFYTSGNLRGLFTSTGNFAVDTDTFFVDAANNRVGVGTTSAFAKLEFGNTNATFNTTTPGTTRYGIHFQSDTAGSNDFATGISWAGNGIGSGAGAQAGIYVQSSTSYGTKMYFATTASYATGAQTAMMIDQNRRVGIGITSPTSRLHLPAGAASANGAPLKFTSGTSLTTPEAGAMEFDGTSLYFTPSTTRKTVAFTDSNITGTSANVTGTVAIANGGTGQSTAIAAFDALSPLTTLGDIIYHNGTDNVRLAGNTTTTRLFLAQTGTGAASAAPVWTNVAAADVVSGAALTEVDDTNVTLTLGGTPTSALLKAVSLTLGWTGTLAQSRGGFGADISSVLQNRVYASPDGMAGSPAFRALVANDIPSLSGLYLPLAGGTMSGDINLGNNELTNVNNITIGTATVDPIYAVDVNDTSAAGIISRFKNANTGSQSYISVEGDTAVTRVWTSGSAVGGAAPFNSNNTSLIQGTGAGGLYLMANDAAGIISFITAGLTTTNERMRIAANGNVTVDTNVLFVDAVNNRVGVGTASPSYRFDINFGAVVGVLTAGITNTDTGAASDARLTLFNSTTNGGIIQRSTGHATEPSDLVLYSAADDIQFYTNGSNRMTLTSAGNFTVDGGTLFVDAANNEVGIGTTAPGQRLEVAGTLIVTGNSDLPTSTGTNVRIAAGYASPDIGRIFIGDGTGWKLHFSSRTGSTNTDRVTFTDAGRVGIGATTPGVRLDVSETLAVATSSTFSAAAIRMNPVYTATGTITVKHRYLHFTQPTISGGTTTFTDAHTMYFDAAAGTHKAVDAGTTKTTPGTVNAWVKIDINGTTYYVPAYTSKTT